MLYSLYETPRPLSVASGDGFVWCGWCYVWLHVYIIKYIYIYMHVEKTAVYGAAARSYACLFGLVSVWSGSQYEDLFGALIRVSHFKHGRWLYYERGRGKALYVSSANTFLNILVVEQVPFFSKWARVEGLADS